VGRFRVIWEHVERGLADEPAYYLSAMAKKTTPKLEEAGGIPDAPVEKPAKEEKSTAEKKPAGEKKPPSEKKSAKKAEKAAPEAAAEQSALEKPAADKTAPVASAPAEAAAKTSAPPAAGETVRKKARPHAPPRGKKLKNHLKNIKQKILKEGAQPLPKAVATLKSLKRSKMDETVEIHMHLGVDANQSDQLVRGTVSLPHGVGKSVRVLVFCQADNIAKAKAAGADYAGAEDLIEKVQKEGFTDFDVALATADMMGKVGRLGKVLGPRGLMPTPKAGTVVAPTADIGQAVKEFKAGKVEYRTDKSGCVHAGVGKLSFEENKLVENIQTFIDQVRSARPAAVKGNYLLSASVSATQSPGIRIAL
jgi:large subunit ribosomal protein L1